MKRPHTRTSALAVHYRPLVGKVTFVALLLLAVWLMVASRNPNSLAHNATSSINDAIVPVINVLAKPMDSVASLATWIGNVQKLEKENDVLKAENLKLRQWYSQAAELQSENAKLRDLLKFVPAGKSAYISARTATDSTSPYSRSIVVTSGRDNGVAQDAAVINDRGMIGRVVEVGQKTARVLLLTDINSRIPVMAEGSREHSIAAGGAGDNLTLMYVPENSKLKVGERMVTSGDGAVLPPGLPIGLVTKIEKNTVTVTPFADWYRIEYVSVLDFSQ